MFVDLRLAAGLYPRALGLGSVFSGAFPPAPSTPLFVEAELLVAFPCLPVLGFYWGWGGGWRLSCSGLKFEQKLFVLWEHKLI